MNKCSCVYHHDSINEMKPNNIHPVKMRSVGIVISFLLAFCQLANAQHNPNDLLQSENWNIIATLELRLEKNNDIYPIFSEVLKSKENKDFELTGYLIPIREGLRQTRFLLSTLPINQCFYCGQNGVPAMVLVEMAEGIKFTYKPIRLKGRLKLKKVNLRDYPPIILVNTLIMN